VCETPGDYVANTLRDRELNLSGRFGRAGFKCEETDDFFDEERISFRLTVHGLGERQTGVRQSVSRSGLEKGDHLIGRQT
jgi:hypothetical protein